MPSSTQQYANREWARAEIGSLKEGVREAKLLGFEAKEVANKPHECKQQNDVESLREEQMKMLEELGNWRFFKKLVFALIGLFFSITLTAAGAIFSFALSAKESTLHIESTVNHLNLRQSALVKRVEAITASKLQEQQEQLVHIQKIIEDTMVKLDTESDKRKKKKRR